MEKYPHGTRVFKTRVSLFYFFLLLLRVLLPRVLFFPSSSSFFDAANLKTRSSNRPPSVQSSNRPNRLTQHSIDQIISSFFLYSSELQIVPLQICSSSVLLQIVLPLFFFRFDLFQVQKSSLRDLVLLFITRVYKTRDLCGIILPTHQVGIESIKLEMLVFNILSNAC